MQSKTAKLIFNTDNEIQSINIIQGQLFYLFVFK